ncbi:MAG: hypothetical protein HYZ49_12785 [Chloroflexi bacterium]|nr:hypothetical protein [Chloroflexota bacterium]
MTLRVEECLPAIDRATLTPRVQRALNSETVELNDWTLQPIHSGFEVRAGVYRLIGRAHDHERAVPWSLILKIVRPAPGSSEDDPHDWNYLKRDALAYQSSLLADLPGGLAAPRCFAVLEQAEGEIWIWLEEVRDDIGSKWPLLRYGLAARHLGRFNGAYLNGRSLPHWPWLSREWLRVLVTQAAPAMAQLPSVLNHPLLCRLYPDDVAEGIFRLWADREPLLSALDRLPRTFCHRDAFRRNLFARRGADGQEQTVAIDWVFAGAGAIGEEAVAPVAATLGFREVDLAEAAELEKVVFENYLAGLRDSGWEGDSRLARFGYAAAAPLRYCLGGTRNLLPVMLDESQHPRFEKMWGDPIHVYADYWARMFRYLLTLADEARGLLRMMDAW